MSHYVIELIVWILVAFFIGCLIGWLLRNLFGAREEPAASFTPAKPVAKPVETLAAAPKPAPVVTPAPVPAAPKPIEPEILAPLPVSAVPGAARMERPKGIETARGGKPDNLQMISGVGPKNEQILHNLGFYHFDQIASWTPAQVAWVDDHLKFGGRIEREEWIEQARLLAAGNYDEFRRKFGTGGMSEEEFDALTGKTKPAAAPAATLASSAATTSAPMAPAPAKSAAPAAAPVAATAPAAAPARMERPSGIAAARGGRSDNLQMLSGVGPKNEQVLHGLGFYHFDQIAAWTPSQVAWVDDHLKFGGRIEREEWIPQAKLLAAGDYAEFRRRYGTGGMSEEEFARAAKGESGTGRPAATAKPAAEAKPQPVASAAAEKPAAAKAARAEAPKGIDKPRGGKADNLQRISGVGPKNEKILHGLGFFHFDQIAAWTPAQVAWVDDHLKFGGRIEREEWITQCKLLAAGKEAEFAARWGTGGLKSDKKK